MRKALIIHAAWTLVALITALPSSSSARRGLQQVDRVYDFGMVGIGYTIYHEFKAHNPSDQAVRLDSVFAKCDCSRVWVPDSTLNPGDTVTIGLEFETSDYYGYISKAVRVFTSDSTTPRLDFFYVTTVGQWFYGLKPDPISLFFLPGHSSLSVKIPNPAFDRITISEIDPYDDLVSVEVTAGEVDKGQNLELKVMPRDGLGKGTYHTNFRATIVMPETDEPIYITIPVKIVRY